MPPFNLCLTREQTLCLHQVITVEADTREEAKAIFNHAIIDCDGPIPKEETGDAFTIDVVGRRILIGKPIELVADEWTLT